MTILLRRADKLFGVSSKILIKTAHNLMLIDSAEKYDLAVLLGVPEQKTEELWAYFKNNRYIILEKDGRHRPTKLMHELAMGRIGNPISRAKANEIVEKILKNAHAANQSNEAMFYVERLCVFGSFLDESNNSLGDIDIAWTLVEKPEFHNRIISMIIMNVDCESHMRRLVIPRGGSVKLTPFRDVLQMKCNYRIIFDINDGS